MLTPTCLSSCDARLSKMANFSLKYDPGGDTSPVNNKLHCTLEMRVMMGLINKRFFTKTYVDSKVIFCLRNTVVSDFSDIELPMYQWKFYWLKGQVLLISSPSRPLLNIALIQWKWCSILNIPKMCVFVLFHFVSPIFFQMEVCVLQMFISDLFLMFISDLFLFTLRKKERKKKMLLYYRYRHENIIYEADLCWEATWNNVHLLQIISNNSKEK